MANPATFTPQDVLEDNTWSVQVADRQPERRCRYVHCLCSCNPVNRDNLANTQYATVSLIIRKPFISATASQSVVAAGDKLYIRGTAQGKPNTGYCNLDHG